MNIEKNIEELLEAPAPLPWPKAGDVLFQSGNDWWNNACLSRFHGKEMYVIGYKESADMLVRSVAETGRNADTFVYPITFLYRHYLELRLKDLVQMGQELLDQAPDVKLNHRLDILWGSCREILESVWPG